MMSLHPRAVRSHWVIMSLNRSVASPSENGCCGEHLQSEKGRRVKMVVRPVALRAAVGPPDSAAMGSAEPKRSRRREKDLLSNRPSLPSGRKGGWCY